MKNTFTEKISAALDAPDARAAGERVHKVVAAELRSLDRTAKTEVTGYFNHSYVPDFVMTWGTGRRAEQRPIFLRHSLRSSRAAGDFKNFDRSDVSAFYLSLAPEEPDVEAELVRAQADEHRQSRVLVTTVPALTDLATPRDKPDPVLGLVRSSVVRSAKGAIVGSDIENLVLPHDRQIEQHELEAFSATVTSVFTEEAVLRINRVFGIVEQALAEQPDIEALLLSGALTETEISELVPYLLSLDGVTHDRQFWVAVARLINLDEIERMWSRFKDLDLTPLASAGSALWRATRLQMSIRSDAIDNEEFDRTPRWSTSGNLLAAEVGDWRLTFANERMKLKTSDRNLLPARWEDLVPSLDSYTVTEVDLRGVATKSQYGSRASGDMKQRIGSFIENADDSFHVPSVTLLSGVGDEASEVTANFSEMMLDALPATDLATLTRAALGVLGYRHATPQTEIDALLEGKPLDGAGG